MSEGLGLLPLAMDESDLLMLIMALFILSILVIALFIALPFFYAFLGTLFIVFGILYGVRVMMRDEEKREM